MVEELFHLTDDETGMLSQDAYPDLSATYPQFTELYRYQVPVDRKLTFKPGHTFSLLGRKLADQAVGGAVADDGGSETIETVEANEATANDITLTPTTPAVNDAYYFGYRFPFSGLTVKYSTASTDAGQTVVWEYWNGSAWVAVAGLTDGTAGWVTAAATLDVTWTMPNDWVAGGSGDSGTTPPTLFWVRCRVTACPTPNQATGDQAWIHPDPTAMDNIDKIKLEVRDENELVRKPLIANAQYRQVSEFTDRDKIYRLDIAEPVVANAGDWVVVSVQAASPIDVSACYFDLTCDRERLAII